MLLSNPQATMFTIPRTLSAYLALTLSFFFLLLSSVSTTNQSGRDQSSSPSKPRTYPRNVPSANLLFGSVRTKSKANDSLCSVPAKQHRIDSVDKIKGEYHWKTPLGTYYLANESPVGKITQNLVKVTFSGYYQYNYFNLVSENMFCRMMFPSSVAIIAPIFFPKKACGRFFFPSLVDATENVTFIIRFIYEQTGLLSSMLSFPSGFAADESFHICSLKYFVPTLLAYIQKKGMTNLKGLEPFIGPMFSKVSQLPYFNGPLRLLKDLLSENYSISFTIASETKLPSGGEIDLQLMHIVHKQLPEKGNCVGFELFFQNLWKEIVAAQKQSSTLMQKFYSVRFTKMLWHMVSNSTIVLDDDSIKTIFAPFMKLKQTVGFFEFVRIIFPIDSLRETCQKVHELMRRFHSIFTILSDDARRSYLMFLRQFVLFRIFFFQHCFYYEFQRFKLLKLGEEELVQNVQAFKPELQELESLEDLIVSLKSLAAFVSHLTLTGSSTDHSENRPHSTASAVTNTGDESKLMVNLLAWLHTELDSLRKVFAYVDLAKPGECSLLEIILSNVDFLTHSYHSVEAGEKKKIGLILTTMVINEKAKVLGKKVSARTVEDIHCLQANKQLFHVLFSKSFFETFERQLDDNQKSELYGCLIKHSLDVQQILDSDEFTLATRAEPNQ